MGRERRGHTWPGGDGGRGGEGRSGLSRGLLEPRQLVGVADDDMNRGEDARPVEPHEALGAHLEGT